MNILGINYIFHDTAACIVSDNELKCAIEEERLLRQKHTSNFPYRAIERCLEESGLSYLDINHIAVSINPNLAVMDKIQYAAGLNMGTRDFMFAEIGEQNARHLSFWKWFEEHFPTSQLSRPTVHCVDHHHAHAIGSYLVSPWDEAALLAIDGGGEWRTHWMGQGKGSQIQPISETTFPHSLGTFYSAVTEFCGFKPMYDEGKTMGLAPTGDPNRFFDTVNSMISVNDDGTVKLENSWFQIPVFVTGRFCGPKMIEALGAPRISGEQILERHRDAAAAFQAVLEKAVLKLTSILSTRTGMRNLVHSGGVALNSVANGKILQNGHFDDIYVMPNAGDAGSAIGAAAYVHKIKLHQPGKLKHANPFIGDSYTDDQIQRFLDQAKLAYRRSEDPCVDAARALHKGHIIGWFQGKMEFGPRALGGRSILADPTKGCMKDKINSEVKHREAFRPFSPSVLDQFTTNYFDAPVLVPFMSSVFNTKDAVRKNIPAVVHVDGSARLQTVEREVNPLYYRLIEEFAKLSGHPLLLNTSFNVMGEPIVASPADAVRCFYSTGLDALYIGNLVLEK
ncbi:carbamoyltransferase C-terminal domain-containing protein [Mesorhizobium sp.]|uniref:carbamoyltransferase family protein n=1 Tax=Mesorhizobium sp. TaxID=1871066 RepID=UPI000FE7EB6C|nr:carbamoyltransferase C-terminal domain-containing protein [Mesorhizobium sp.]RWB25612.1 MAG: carbamoyltransferase [Mesorhizobium sp.]